MIRYFTFIFTLFFAQLVFADSKATLLATPFEAGITHSHGRYAFTNNNFLIEGADTIQNVGSKSIFVYLNSDFVTSYPQKGGLAWGSPKSLVQLAQSAPYKALFAMPFKMFVLTSFSFANKDGYTHFPTSTSPAMSTEYQEYHDLVYYLEKTYAGTNKVFILKNWEGDNATMAAILNNYSDSTVNDPAQGLTDMINMMSARSHGCHQGRADAGNPSGVAVLCAAEVNLVLDHLIRARVVDKVLPKINPPMDMVTYSSYESNIWTRSVGGQVFCNNCANGTQAQQQTAVTNSMNQALNIINQYAPDPLGLGRRRILLSEYGMFEMHHPSGDAAWRTHTILSTAKAYGTSGAFIWQVYDNQCANFMTEVGGINASLQKVAMPTSPSQCDGLWIRRPDGSTSSVLSVLQTFFQ